jgi:hypothetical protein
MPNVVCPYVGICIWQFFIRLLTMFVVWCVLHVPISAIPYVKSYIREIFIRLFDDISGPFFGGGGGVV